MEKLLGAKTPQEAVKMVCTNREKMTAMLKEQMGPCVMEEIKNHKASKEDEEKMKKFNAMDPEKRKAAVRAKVKEVMECKLKALA